MLFDTDIAPPKALVAVFASNIEAVSVTVHSSVANSPPPSSTAVLLMILHWSAASTPPEAYSAPPFSVATLSEKTSDVMPTVPPAEKMAPPDAAMFCVQLEPAEVSSPSAPSHKAPPKLPVAALSFTSQLPAITKVPLIAMPPPRPAVLLPTTIPDAVTSPEDSAMPPPSDDAELSSMKEAVRERVLLDAKSAPPDSVAALAEKLEPMSVTDESLTADTAPPSVALFCEKITPDDDVKLAESRLTAPPRPAEFIVKLVLPVAVYELADVARTAPPSTDA
mmetsp:Transcript_16094/g.38211  ORF Transcript_16094/g.38211 Transcript_16094/m.38211 type:complete len:279 (+) Transcript_16094:3473-4309(+)